MDGKVPRKLSSDVLGSDGDEGDDDEDNINRPGDLHPSPHNAAWC